MTARPEIRFISMSTDADKIRFFGTLMPALPQISGIARAVF